MSDTLGVTFHVAGVERTDGCGTLLAVAIVEMNVAGMDFTLQGIQVRRTPNQQMQCQAPQWRHPKSGKWLPAVLLPPELRDAIGAEVLAEMELAA